MVLVQVFVKCLEQQRPDQSHLCRGLKSKGYMCVTCQDFCAFIATPEEAVELRAAVNSPGMSAKAMCNVH